ncbi:MAG: hypothetical protein LJE66_08610 [Desulfobacterales bacterium]|nr:hypothetical protein [Desulfobacterales bacterium]
MKIDVETTYVERKPAGPLKVALKVNGKIEDAQVKCLVTAAEIKKRRWNYEKKL